MFENPAQIVEVLARHEGDHGVLAVEITVDETDADPSLGADVVHRREVETAAAEAGHRRAQDLTASVLGVVGDQRCFVRFFHVNEYSFTW